jgi:hypothetical protein
VGSEWRLSIMMSAEKFLAWVIGDLAVLGEEEISEGPLCQLTHPSATQHPRLPAPPHQTLTCCATHAHPLLPTAKAFVPYGFVLVQVKVRVQVGNNVSLYLFVDWHYWLLG